MRVRRVILLILGIINSSAMNAQYVNHWYLADRSIDFTLNPVGIHTETRKENIYKFEGAETPNFGGARGITKAQISSTSQSHSFYCNGLYAFDKNFDTMNNKKPLGIITGDASLVTTTVNNSSLFLSTPDSNIFYLINSLNDTNIVYWYNEPIHFNISLFKIDTRLRGGKGDIFAQEVLLTDTLDAKGVYGVKHSNGKDWWLTVHRMNDNKYYKILYSDHLLRIDTQAISFHSSFGYIGWEDRTFSTSGQLYANTMQEQGLIMTDTTHVVSDIYTELFSFDRCTGLFNEKKKIHLPKVDTLIGNDITLSRANGVAFSPNERFLYITQNRKVFQYDILLDSLIFIVEYRDLDDSLFIIYTNKYYKEYSISLAPNGKIYFTLHVGTLSPPRYMAAIEYPDRAGLACGFNPFSIDLQSDSVFGGFPNTANYDLGPVPMAENHRIYYDTLCEGKTYQRSIDSFPNTVYTWYEAGTAISHSRTFRQANFSTNSTYTVHIRDTFSSCSDRWDTVYVQVINKPCGVGINNDELGMMDEVRVFPNPASSKLTVALSPSFRARNEREISAIFYNLLGERIHEEILTQEEQEVDISAWAKGVYFVSFRKESLLLGNKKIIIEN